ncbi:MAG: isoleucine--tRNA ligase [Pseudomonadota bacterium]
MSDNMPEYRDTLFLPSTEFPMRGNLPVKEPQILERWQDIGLWQRLRAKTKGREKFILHDGPPYANGHLHLGHAVNKILKDIVNRSRQMMGYDANYVPGWDCHGLPIEWKIEEKYRAEGNNKEDIPIPVFRKECRAFAEHWITVQSQEFQRMGIAGDFANPYTTMAYSAEAQIAREIGKVLQSGGLFRGSKPVLWSIVEKTALAEAEVEYHEHKSTTLFIAFPVQKTISADLQDASIVIWTTTPWTIPGNRGIAYHQDIAYGLYEVEGLGEKPFAHVGQKLVFADDLAQGAFATSSISRTKRLRDVTGDELANIICDHPLKACGFAFDVPVHHADFVTLEQGSGFVHIGPGHGSDDYNFALAHGLEVPETVDDDGSFYPWVPEFAGRFIYDSQGKTGDANGAIIKALIANHTLISKSSLRHSYPHSWRSKAPLIFRNTPQWFIGLETNNLRQIALSAIENTRFFPGSGKMRLYSMIENRPDWCISRQRAWGVPIPVFTNKKTGQPLIDEHVTARIATAFEEEGADCWFSAPKSRFLGPEYDADDYDQCQDILDVWFDSGSTHAFVLEQRDDLQWPATLYLEGTDQHRGWFHSSLLESCATRGRAPYKEVLTHGFTLDEKGRKMSKSLGNGVEPQEVMDKLGADILRLWIVASDYTEDLTIGPNTLKQHAESYRRLRNSLRWLLGNLPQGMQPQPLHVTELPFLERWVLHRLAALDKIVNEALPEYRFHKLFRALHDFCATDLSAIYFDIRKDCLYCDAKTNPARLAAVAVLAHIFDKLCRWLAPIICFTAEEAWMTHFGTGDDDNPISVHFLDFAKIPDTWHNEAVAAQMAKIMTVREAALAALEKARAESVIGSSLEAQLTITLDPQHWEAVHDIDMAEFAITSHCSLVKGGSDDAPVHVQASLAEGTKCARCWKVLPEVRFADQLCNRCRDAIS